jgi:hypothetical protein
MKIPSGSFDGIGAFSIREYRACRSFQKTFLIKTATD